MRRRVIALALGMGLGVLYPLGASLAAEHGGKEHGGASATQEQRGNAPAAAAPSAEMDEAATLREAADALRATRPDLAKKLDKLAEEHAG